MELPKKISQEFFDQIVSENVNEFGMSEEEAISDAIGQLKSQGCELVNICKYGRSEQDELANAVNELSRLVSAARASDEDSRKRAIELLETMKKKFDKDISFRCLANSFKPDGQRNAYQILMAYLESNVALVDNLLLENYLSTLQAFLYQQSDAIDKNGLNTLIRLSQEKSIWETPALNSLLKCLSTTCEMNESNRQHLVENGICESLMDIFCKHKSQDYVLAEACQLIRNLLLDDDIRVEFSNAHETAKYIASKLNGLDVLLSIGLDNENSLSEDTLASIMLTVSKLAVRNEFCQEICDKGGLKFVLTSLDEKHLTNMSLLKSSLSLLKSICNNDQVKHEATKANAICLVKEVLVKYIANSQICELVCSALSSLLLRNSEASEQLFALEVHPFLIQILNIHSTKPKLIRQCCLAMRNSISRNRNLASKMLELKAEESLRKILNQNDPQCYDEVKSVLRDLGCQVELKELWTGTGKNLGN